MQGRRGFTVLEMIIFTGIFSVMAVVFIGALVVTTNLQSREGTSAEVRAESQLVTRILEERVRRASVLEVSSSTPATLVRLRTASSSDDPTDIYLQSGRIYMKIGSGVAEAITSPRVTVDTLSFLKQANPGGRDTLKMTLSLSAAGSGLFSQMIKTGIRRVTAATFDSDLVPDVVNTRKIGGSAGDWQSINNTIFFSGSNVGIGSSLFVPASRLQISNGDVYTDTTGKGIILRSPNGSCFRLTVDNAGVPTSTTMTCP
jgi:type II secretory pathway pseudopilin PulG